jgi:hypothetical protein
MAMIFEKTNDGSCRPRLICDACQRPIADWRTAMVLYGQPPPGEDALLTEVRHAHKNDPCQEQVRRAVGHADWNGTWDELINHLVMLAVDVGIFPSKFNERYDYFLAKGMFPPAPTDND